MKYDNDIIEIICDSLHYPELNAAFENMNLLEQKQFSQSIETVLEAEYQDGYEEREEESRLLYDNGYENGKADTIKVMVNSITKLAEDMGIRDALLKALKADDHES